MVERLVSEERKSIQQILSTIWWVVLLRGVFALLFGITAMAYPGKTILLLVQIMGAFWLMNGIFIIIAAIFGRIYAIKWWVLLLRGLLDIVIGAIIFAHPFVGALITVGFLVYLFAIFALAAGIFEIIMALHSWHEIENKWSILLGGVFSCLFGLLLFARPLVSAAVLMLIVGGVAVIFGVCWILFGLNLRKAAKTL